MSLKETKGAALERQTCRVKFMPRLGRCRSRIPNRFVSIFHIEPMRSISDFVPAHNGMKCWVLATAQEISVFKISLLNIKSLGTLIKIALYVILGPGVDDLCHGVQFSRRHFGISP